MLYIIDPEGIMLTALDFVPTFLVCFSWLCHFWECVSDPTLYLIIHWLLYFGYLSARWQTKKAML